MEKKFSLSTIKKHIPQILYIFVVLSFIIPVIYVIFKMIFGNPTADGVGNHSRADYVLLIVECLLGVAVIHIPMIIERTWKFEIPLVLYILYIVFLYCAIFLGEVYSFYYLIPQWDIFLHSLSSIMEGLFGFIVVTILNRDDKLVVKMSPFFIALFAFSFAVTIGAIWEIYEYTFDGLLGLNMQKFITPTGVTLAGHEALNDTMKDIIVDVCGALIASILGFLSIKKGKYWFSGVIKEPKNKDK